MNAMALMTWVLFLHFVGDFICQTDRVAKRKSKEWMVLLEHVGIYGVVLAWGLCVLPGAVVYAFVNAFIHFWVDAVTSRINSRLHADGRTHAFFVGVGADQFIHAVTLLWTLPLLRI